MGTGMEMDIAHQVGFSPCQNLAPHMCYAPHLETLVYEGLVGKVDGCLSRVNLGEVHMAERHNIML